MELVSVHLRSVPLFPSSGSRCATYEESKSASLVHGIRPINTFTFSPPSRQQIRPGCGEVVIPLRKDSRALIYEREQEAHSLEML